MQGHRFSAGCKCASDHAHARCFAEMNAGVRVRSRCLYAPLTCVCGQAWVDSWVCCFVFAQVRLSVCVCVCLLLSLSLCASVFVRVFFVCFLVCAWACVSLLSCAGDAFTN